MTEPATPGVVKWYKVYAATLAAIYVILLLGCAVGLFFSLRASPDFWQEADMPPLLFYLYLIGLAELSLVLGGAYIAAFFTPRKPWAWTYHIVLICIGFSSACFLPICVPLLIYWLRPEAKAYYGKS